MKDGSRQRLLEPVTEPVPEAASSWSKEGAGELAEGEEEGEEAAVAFDDRVEVEAKALGEGGGEAGTLVLEVGLLDICLAGRWATGVFLGPWPAEALLLGAPSLGPGAQGADIRRPWRFWLRWSSWH